MTLQENALNLYVATPGSEEDASLRRQCFYLLSMMAFELRACNRTFYERMVGDFNDSNYGAVLDFFSTTLKSQKPASLLGTLYKRNILFFEYLFARREAIVAIQEAGFDPDDTNSFEENLEALAKKPPEVQLVCLLREAVDLTETEAEDFNPRNASPLLLLNILETSRETLSVDYSTVNRTFGLEFLELDNSVEK